jgi:hypothetical protein
MAGMGTRESARPTIQAAKQATGAVKQWVATFSPVEDALTSRV